ncbi:AsmA family protein [Pseudodesulfovibrio sp.]|uniref:AsmA family protein n=1 Tax=unclassified Pseudodesulfovibrio TaxID=2661612 RepID=UPI003AFFC9BD
MTKAVHMTLWAGGILAALIVVGLIAFAATFNINDYKARITQAVRGETGRTLTFSGDLELMFFPLGVTVDGASLSNGPGFGETPMASVKTASASFRLWPLLSGNVQVGHVFLDGLEVHLARNEKGVTNWDDLLGGDSAGSTPAKSSKPIRFEADGFVIEHSSLTWDDRENDVSLSVGDLTVAVRNVRPGVPSPLKASCTFASVTPEAKGDISLEATMTMDEDGLSARDVKATVQAESAGMNDGKISVEGVADLLALANGRLEAKGLVLSVVGANIHYDGSLSGLTGGGRKQLVGTVTVDPFNGREAWKSLFGTEPDTADAKALTSIGGTAVVACTPHSLAFNKLDLTVDGEGLRGEAKVGEGDGGVSCYARLDADTLDLDKYLPSIKSDTTEGAEQEPRAGMRILDADLLRRLTVDAQADAAKVHIRGAWLENVKVGVQGRNGLVRVKPLDATLYGGHLSTAITINALTDDPRIDLLSSLDKVDVGGLSSDVLGDKSYAGKLDFKGTLSCEGERVTPMLASTNGKFNLNLADGVFPGVDLLGLAKKAQASQQKEGTVVAADSDSTKFGSISGSGVIKNGVMENRDLDVKAPGWRAAGVGAVSLPTGKINYLLKVKLVASTTGQGGKSGNDMLGIMVPVRVTGNVADPRYSVSLAEYVKALGGAVIDVAGTVFKGVTGVVTTVGKTLVGTEGNSESDKNGEPTEKKKGLFNLFGIF